MKHLLVPVLILLFPLILNSQAPAQDRLSTLVLDFDSLRQWKTRTYTYRAASPGRTEQTNLGKFTLKTTVTSERVELDDSVELTYGGEEMSLRLRHECKRDNFLSPVRIESNGKSSDEFGTFILTVDGTKGKVRRNGDDKPIELPEQTVTSWAFMRLVTLVPRQKGTVLTFDHWMESEELNQKRNYRIESLGPDSIQSGDDEIMCTKFRLDGGGSHPAFYWVNTMGLLQQMLIDERKWIELVE